MKEAINFLPEREGETILPDGTIIVIEYLNKVEISNYSDVDEHEAEHAVVAIRNGTAVIEASVVPEGNTLGHVSLGSPDPIAGATSHGRKGSGGDKQIVEAQGHNFESLAKTSHAIVAKNKSHVRAVASALQRERKLSGKRIREIMDQVDEGEKFRIRIIKPDGKVETLTQRAKEKKSIPIEIKHKAATNDNEKNFQDRKKIIHTGIKEREFIPESELPKAA
ncbi:hypothetical protein A2841_02935 [Candidatus Kaiserbacteria bacterium RIFCSPHIGHO2_01_FULL_48_10]|uniref:Uncharacterized protein n=1 Tax=Candidatus Kaiserbacteria bacterium RIFCSPHIGHO2_01_FULL_48_10 TaxID=1798476 RepID=A0A1F6C613_9BACT|nr:MAG: hypothetical protein A2841_02935 [Candidatus Kaiserbacteria bacterium RIFCSPHIGHO2_01_FULL_48_10]